MRRKLTWVGVILIVLVGTPWAVWVATGPRTAFPDATRRLTTEAHWRWHLRLSPDGRRLAYCVSLSDAGGAIGIEVIDLLNGTIERKSDDGNCPVWLHDGSFAYLGSWLMSDPSRIHVVRNGHQVVHMLLGTENMSSSSEVFADPARNSVFLREFMGSPFVKSARVGTKELAQETMWTEIKSISADGSHVLGIRMHKSHRVYALCNRDGTVLRTVDRLGRDMWQVTPLRCALSPDAARVAFIETTHTLRCSFFQSLAGPQASHQPPHLFRDTMASQVAPALQQDILVYDLASDATIRIAAFPDFQGDIVWHPDGKHLIAQGDGHLWLIPLPQNLWSKPAPGYKDSP